MGISPDFVLDADERDLPIVRAVLDKAQELRLDYDERLAELTGHHTAAKLLPPLARHLSRTIQALARALS